MIHLWKVYDCIILRSYISYNILYLCLISKPKIQSNMIIREKMALKVAVCCEVFPKGFIIKNKKCTAISLFERTALKIMQGARASEMCDVTTYLNIQREPFNKLIVISRIPVWSVPSMRSAGVSRGQQGSRVKHNHLPLFHSKGLCSGDPAGTIQKPSSGISFREENHCGTQVRTSV